MVLRDSSSGTSNDGSWELKIFVTDLKVEKRVRVKGDMHIGGVILKLVEELGEFHCSPSGLLFAQLDCLFQCVIN